MKNTTILLSLALLILTMVPVRAAERQCEFLISLITRRVELMQMHLVELEKQLSDAMVGAAATCTLNIGSVNVALCASKMAEVELIRAEIERFKRSIANEQKEIDKQQSICDGTYVEPPKPPKRDFRENEVFENKGRPEPLFRD